MKTKLIFAAIFCFALTTMFLLLMGAAWSAPFLGIAAPGYGLAASLWSVLGFGVAVGASEVK